MSATTNFDSHMMCTVGIKSENCSIYGCRSTLFIVGKLLISTSFQILNDFFLKNCNIYGNFYDKMVGQRCNFIGPQYNWPTQLYFFRILGGKNQCLHGFSINEEMSKIVDFFLTSSFLTRIFKLSLWKFHQKILTWLLVRISNILITNIAKCEKLELIIRLYFSHQIALFF